MKIIFSSLLTLAVVGFYLTHSEDSSRLAKVQSGELTLECHIGDGSRVIDPAKVTNYSEGRWFFSNGSATQCTTTASRSLWK